MGATLLAIVIVVPAVVVVIAIVAMVWRASTSPRSALVAAVAGLVLIGWLAGTSIAAQRGFYLPPPPPSPPPVGIQLLIALAGLSLALALSPSLRGLLTNQRFLIRLNVWRLVGAVFLALMVTGQVPALWAVPAGVGDVAIGATAFWVAGGLDAPGGKRRAMLFNWLGLLDLVVAVVLGVITSPGVGQLVHTTPTMELVTHFPLVLVPTFLVPLAVMVHVVSLWQLSGRPWSSPPVPLSPSGEGERTGYGGRAAT